MIVFIDMGHDSTTQGKRSPDGTFFEWEFNRKLGRAIIEELKARGIDARPTTYPTEDHKNTYLTVRAKRANEIARAVGSKNVLFVSIHSNAAGDGQSWQKARGWSVYVSKHCSDASKELATSIAAQAEHVGFKVRKPLPTQPYWTENFTVLTDTLCPAVLTESFFYDNKEDLALLRDEKVLAQLVQVHVDGIVGYINTFHVASLLKQDIKKMSTKS